MKLSKLIAGLELLLKKEGDLDVGIHTPDYGSYACDIGAVKAGEDGTLTADGFRDGDGDGRMAVIFGRN